MSQVVFQADVSGHYISHYSQVDCLQNHHGCQEKIDYSLPHIGQMVLICLKCCGLTIIEISTKFLILIL